jgi:hypothetical protein
MAAKMVIFGYSLFDLAKNTTFIKQKVFSMSDIFNFLSFKFFISKITVFFIEENIPELAKSPKAN